MLGDHDPGTALAEVGDDRNGVERLVGNEATKADAIERVTNGQALSSPVRQSQGRLFCALSMTVNLHGRGIDHRIFHVWRVRAGIEYPLEHVGSAPVPNSATGCAPVADMHGRSRHALPARAIHSTASINSRLFLPLRPGSVTLPKAMRFHLRPSGVGQN
jgi:hypothetical protein